MQGEVHGMATLPSRASVQLEAPAAVTSARLQQSASFGEHRAASFSVCGGDSHANKAQQHCEGLMSTESFGFGTRSATSRMSSYPMGANMIASEAAVANFPSPPVQEQGSQGFVLEIAHPMGGYSSFTSLTTNAPLIDGTSMSDAASTSRLVVVGHRGCGKNKMTVPSQLGGGASDAARSSIRENTITSFNLAARNGAQFVEFDVQVTKDGVPVIFHDDVIITDAALPGRHIGELTLEEFRAMGPQSANAISKVGQSLYRKTADGSVGLWTVDVEDAMCTLAEAFAQVQPNVGFNIEVKFDDDGDTSQAELHRVIDAVLADVRQFANGRMIYFSSFHPDAVHILRKDQSPLSSYPVFFLTDGGSYMYSDPRRNSIEAAIQVCREGDLQGIVSEVTSVLQRPAAVALVKSQGLFFFTYGELNNVGEAVLKQQSMGVDGVIVDHVLEMVRVARHMDEPAAASIAASGLGRRRVSVG